MCSFFLTLDRVVQLFPIHNCPKSRIDMLKPHCFKGIIPHDVLFLTSYLFYVETYGCKVIHSYHFSCAPK